MTSSLKDFLASRLADSNCSKKSASDRAIRIPYTITHKQIVAQQDWFKVSTSRPIKVISHSHLSSSTTHCLNHHRISNLGSLSLEPLIWLVLSMVTTYDRHPSSRHNVFGCTKRIQSCINVFVMYEVKIKKLLNPDERPFNAHVPDGGGRWADKDDTFLFTRLCKLCVFWQEAVTGVDRLCTRSSFKHHIY